MARYAYDRLSPLDNLFLLLEDPDAYMHVASVGIFEAAPLRAGQAGSIDFEAVLRATEALLHRIPRYRQKLKWIPFEGSPVWVDDAGFNLRYHVRHTALPRPGPIRQLKRLAARIMSQHLDRSKPLWEMWVVEGLEGDRFAIITKIHHCMIDGIAGVDLMTILLSTRSDSEIPESPSFLPRRAPSGAELARDELARRVRLPLQALREVRSFRRASEDPGEELRRRTRALVGTLGKLLSPPSETPVNLPIGSHRRFDWMRMDLDEVKGVAKALGGSLNDVVLGIVAGAVRSFMLQRNVEPGSLRFRVLAPVSVRADTERGSMGNRISAWIVDLPIDEADARTRLAHIVEQTAEYKHSGQAAVTELLTELADWVPTGLLSLAPPRLLSGALPFNMVVTNVPGPQIPLYLLGARLLEQYANVPLAHRLGLGLALFSYDGKLFWGFNAEWEQLPDLHDFIEQVQLSFDDLRDASGIGAFTEQAVH
jgi:WS/DGAT/MGAT family acyltransferase